MSFKITPKQFQASLLGWFDQHGRKNLPWQENKTPYRVWISEIMLQQTQVSTVIPYYLRFMQVFPDVHTLANASEDSVLHLWAGLGYYSRARNLYRAAKMIQTEFAGNFPNNLDDLILLPGIGHSTAGAILAIAFNQPATILDGNVKRVLTRLHAITNPVNEKMTENKLWEIAQTYTPQERIADYTQAIMDLGATLCTRSKPQCLACPFIKKCLGYKQGLAASLPIKKAGKTLPIRTATFVILKQNENILLRKRPSSGIWGGLWSLPEIVGAPENNAIQLYCQQQFNLTVKDYFPLASFRHTFSHYHLDIFPVIVKVKKLPAKIMEAGQQIWYNPKHPESIGLPKPVKTILGNL